MATQILALVSHRLQELPDVSPQNDFRGQSFVDRLRAIRAAAIKPSDPCTDALRNIRGQIGHDGVERIATDTVAEEFPAGTLSDLPGTDIEGFGVREISTELGRAIHAMSEAGLRHRDLRPSAILVRSSDPLDLVVTGFGSARLSEFDLDIASPLETSRYMAPETIAGGVAPASDWWSLGMLLLERMTAGACFDSRSARLGSRFSGIGTPLVSTWIRNACSFTPDLAGGGFIAQQRNAVLVGGTGTGTTHMAIAIARSCIRFGARGRFYNVVDLVNRLEIETRNGRQGRIAEHLTRMDFIVLDELGYLPFAQSAASCCSISSAGSTSVHPSLSPPILPSVNGPACSATPR